MQDKIDEFKAHVRDVASNPNFVHHKWFVKWHLEVVERLAEELIQHYPEADRNLVSVMVWLHDYGKILGFSDHYARTLTAGREKLNSLGFDAEFVEKAVSNIELLDKKLEVDLRTAPIEVQIVSSSDGGAHMVGPFLYIFWHEATDRTFTDKSLDELMLLTRIKVEKDWNHKIVLPEARKAFDHRYRLVLEQSGQLPDHIFEGF